MPDSSITPRARGALRYAPAAAALAAGVALSSAVFFLAHRAEHAALEAQFRADGTERVSAISAEIRDDLQSLESVSALFDASERVSREDFARFTRGIASQLDTVQAVEWAPRTAGGARAQLVAQARSEGLADFELTELDANGDLRPATRRDEYFPVYYVEPYAGNERVPGLDLASNAARRDALLRARDSGTLQISEPLTLVQAARTEAGVLAFLPVYRRDAAAHDTETRRAALRGFVVGVLRVGGIVDKALSGFSAGGARLRLLDLDAPSSQRLMHSTGGPDPVPASGPVLTQDIDIGGRTWRIEARPGPGRSIHARDWVAHALLASGLLVTAVITLYLSTALRRTFQIERTVAARTAELSSANTRLEDEIRVRRSAQLGQQRFFTLSLDMLCIAGFDGYFKELNPAWSSVLGYSLDELKARPFVDFVHPDDREATLAEAGRLARGSDVVSFENRYCCRDGGYRWLLWSAAADSEHERVLAVARDITERKQIEEIKNEFISTVSHELRTPLTSIRGSLGLLHGGVAGALPEKARNLVEIATNNCDRLVRLVNDILDIEKIESGKLEMELQPLDLADTIRDAVSAITAFATEHDVRIAFPSDAPKLSIRGDHDRIVQVATNLLSNAIKFSPAGERVDVQITADPSGRARVSVLDRGPGVPEESRSRIFERFVQADSPDTRGVGGTGLGLSIAKSIVERLGGQIGYEPAEGGGSLFFFELPVATASAHSTSAADLPTVLVCEDDDVVAELMGATLSAHGYSVEIAPDVATTLQRLRTRRYDALTLDLVLPDGNGVDILRALRADARTETLPVVVVSARADSARRAINGGGFTVVDWLDKPVDGERLVADVRRAVRMSQAQCPRILHVEDDPDVSRVLSATLDERCRVVTAPTLSAARHLLADNVFDLVILDLQMPDGSGIELLPELNRVQPPPPIIVFSAFELSRAEAERVSAALVKTRVSQDELIHTIETLLAQARRQPSDDGASTRT